MHSTLLKNTQQLLVVSTTNSNTVEIKAESNTSLHRYHLLGSTAVEFQRTKNTFSLISEQVFLVVSWKLLLRNLARVPENVGTL
jgi:hypothetical protein